VRPLDRLKSIKVKLGIVIVGAVFGTTVAIVLGVTAGLGLKLSALISALVGLLFIQVLARGMTSPLREMAAASREMSKGDYSRRVTATSRDEVGELARAFNQMAAELEEVDRVRRDLVANVSHELRTPISALQAVLENLVDGVEPPDPTTLRTMLMQVERLGRLVNQLLDLSKLESGVVPLQRRRFELRPLLEQAGHEARVHAEQTAQAQVRIDVEVSPDDLTADGDPERLHQVISNLLDNAVRHSPAGGSVLLNARGSGSHIELEVLDEGPGIPPGEEQRVFERFYRSDTARSASEGGTGLGLAIARWIVDLHGGEIRAESRRPQGCRMVVELPGVAA
jgi:signal transduction histidine kinase